MDDCIDWYIDPKNFVGFEIVKNGTDKTFDVYGMSKYSQVEKWVRCGFLRLSGYDFNNTKVFGLCFMFSMMFSLPFYLRLLWF